MRIRFTHWLLLALILILVPFWWLLIDTDRGTARAKPVHIDALRALASAMPGSAPTDVTYTLLGSRYAVGDYFAAGIGLKRRSMAMIAWSLPVPGKGPIMIDPGVSPAPADIGIADFDRSRLEQVTVAAQGASLVLQTQGIAPWHGSLVTARAVAPGVVVIPAPGYVPGARLVFVRLADGREFLFAGNIAALSENWSQLRARSRLAARWGPPQNSSETYAWLRTIEQLRREAPRLVVVPGHDYAWLSRQRKYGSISPAQLALPSQSTADQVR